MAIALNTVIVDGQEYKPGDVIPDFKSIKCVDTREPRKYQGLSADVSVLNDVIAKYASGGASCFMSDTGEYYEYDREEKAWKLITNITERGFDSEKAYGALRHMLNLKNEVIDTSVKSWLDNHPEATTTVQDESIEEIKINKNFLPWIKKDYVTPKMFGAKGDGITDDTESIQYALNEAEKTGKTVFIPDGNYVIKSLTIPKAVSIVGANNNFGTNRIVTAFYCTDRNNPAILMNSYSSIDNIAFYYPNQRVVNNYAVTYPETIALTDSEITTLVKIRNIFLVNAYYGINATAKHEKMLIENIWGYCIVKGLIVDGCTDVDMISNVHFNFNTLRVFYDETVMSQFETQTANTGLAFQFGRSDTSYIKNLFAYGYRIGVQLITSETATNKLPPTYTVFDCISMDTCDFPLWVGNCANIFINNFVGIAKNHNNNNENIIACLYSTSGTGLNISNSLFSGFGKCASINSDETVFNNCVFRNYNRLNKSTDKYAIESKRGDVCVNSCTILGSKSRETGFAHITTGTSFTAIGNIIKNLSDTGKLIEVDNDAIITSGLNTIINSNVIQ